MNVLAKPSIQDIPVVGGSVTPTWSAIANVIYREQFKHDLNEANWTDLVPDVTATGPTAPITDTPGGARGFYCVLVVNP